jgi:prepilin-type N-terminal cleavage/methylation domain-containing protein
MHRQVGFSLIEVIVAIGIMGGASLGFMRVMDLQTQIQIEMKSSLELSRLQTQLTYSFQSSDACKNTFENISIGDSLTNILDKRKK